MATTMNPTKISNEARSRALDSVHKWLWKGADRQTTGSEWPPEYVNDAASMILAATKELTFLNSEAAKEIRELRQQKVVDYKGATAMNTEISNEAREAANRIVYECAELGLRVPFKPVEAEIQKTINTATKELRERNREMGRITARARSVARAADEALNPIHTCHNECQRPACVLRRENETLREALGLWIAWYKDSDAGGGPIHATRELLSKP